MSVGVLASCHGKSVEGVSSRGNSLKRKTPHLRQPYYSSESCGHGNDLQGSGPSKEILPERPVLKRHLLSKGGDCVNDKREVIGTGIPSDEEDFKACVRELSHPMSRKDCIPGQSYHNCRGRVKSTLVPGMGGHEGPVMEYVQGKSRNSGRGSIKLAPTPTSLCSQRLPFNPKEGDSNGLVDVYGFCVPFQYKELYARVFKRYCHLAASSPIKTPELRTIFVTELLRVIQETGELSARDVSLCHLAKWYIIVEVLKGSISSG